MLFSKHVVGRFPEEPEVLGPLAKRLGSVRAGQQPPPRSPPAGNGAKAK